VVARLQQREQGSVLRREPARERHPAGAPSRFATRSSNTAVVGFMMREYVFPYSCRLK
jgi:hypothetical protein